MGAFNIRRLQARFRSPSRPRNRLLSIAVVGPYEPFRPSTREVEEAQRAARV
jgi:hypothetical protein